jgi:quinoprotein glucose dehydrogenase
MRHHLLAGALLVLPGLAAIAQDWPEYGRDKAGTRYSALDQITPANVSELEPAWTYHTGEMQRRGAAFARSKDQNTPILVAGHLILCTPFNRVVALDPATGAERWVFDAEVDESLAEAGKLGAGFACRGVAAWRDDKSPRTASCHERLIFGTNDVRLIAIDAASGAPCRGFGVNGVVSVAPEQALAFVGELSYVTPPVIANGVVVLGSSIVDTLRSDAPSGSVQAFDARTGSKLWQFDPIPRDATDPAAATWTNDSYRGAGGANVWSAMAVDETRDLVFLPTSTPAPDDYGGLRPGANAYANSLVALRGATGEVVWHFQIVHHSIWDYDIASQPLLVDLPRAGETVPAVVQNTKQGLVFIFHRETGEPLFPIDERAVPAGEIPGEWYAPTQPFPRKPPPLVPHGSSPDDAWGFTFWDRGKCRELLKSFQTGPIYSPPSFTGTVVSPWTAGGANWGGAAYDPARHWMVINTNRLMKVTRLVEVSESEAAADSVGGAFDPPKPMPGTPYGLQEMVLLSPLGAPCSKPPWGGLTAVDLVTGEIVWDVSLGSIERELPIEIEWNLGVPNIGGPIATGGGLIFIAATIDRLFRAFDLTTGKQLWRADLPASAHATPMTYQVGGRQFVVIVAGGHYELPGPRADAVIAYALPD